MSEGVGVARVLVGAVSEELNRRPIQLVLYFRAKRS